MKMSRTIIDFVIRYAKRLTVIFPELPILVVFFVSIMFYNFIISEIVLSLSLFIESEFIVYYEEKEDPEVIFVGYVFWIYEQGFEWLLIFVFAYLFKNFYLSVTNLSEKYALRSYIILAFLIKIVKFLNFILCYINLTDILITIILNIVSIFDFFGNKVYSLVLINQTLSVDTIILYCLVCICFFVLTFFIINKIKQKLTELYKILFILTITKSNLIKFNLLFSKKKLNEPLDPIDKESEEDEGNSKSSSKRSTWKKKIIDAKNTVTKIIKKKLVGTTPDKKVEENIPLEKQVESMNNLFLTHEFEQKMKDLESKLVNRYKHIDNLLKNNPDSPEGYKQSFINLKTSYKIEFESRKKKLIAEYNEKLKK